MSTRKARRRHHPPIFYGANHPNWKGGRYKDGRYIRAWAPEHPQADKTGYVREHILVASKALGKPLPKGVEVHHVDEDKTNNAPGNLVICPNRAYHLLLHARQRALETCGNANWRKCRYCQKYDDVSTLVATPNGKGGLSYRHIRCAPTK